MLHFRNRCTFLQLFTNSCAKRRLSVSSKLFWVYSYLFHCCVSVCGESLSSLRCSPSMRWQLSEMIITQTASALPSQLSAGGWLCPAHRGALAGLPQWPKPTYITRSSTEEIRGPLTYITEWKKTLPLSGDNRSARNKNVSSDNNIINCNHSCIGVLWDLISKM